MVLKFYSKPAFLAFSVFLLNCILLHVRGKHHHGTYCQFNGNWNCAPITRQQLSTIDLPPNVCAIHECRTCIKYRRTFLFTKDMGLLEPSNFILREHKDETDDRSTTYKCLTAGGKFCDCDNGCTGSTQFCHFRNCSRQSSCSCHLTRANFQLVAITPHSTIINPAKVTLESCLWDMKTVNISRVLHRKLLEGETAVFRQHNYSIRFEDPILYLPDTGRVILRSSEFEHVLSVPDDKMIHIPFEFLAFKTVIQVIYLHPSGQTVSGLLHVTGKSVCQVRQCIFCTTIFNHFKCFHPLLQYIFYGIIAMSFMILCICVKLLIQSLKAIYHVLLLSIYSVFRLCRLMARFSLLCGAYLGSILRDFFQDTYSFLERRSAREENSLPLPLVLLACTLLVAAVSADCNTHAVIQSDLKSCDILQDGTRTCNLFTTSEVTLPTISSETCLWFADKKGNHLFSLKIKLDSVLCSFQKERMYFTFPITAKHISQVSCIFNKFCGKGVHCSKRFVGQGGINFEAETDESRDFPGISACLAGGLGVGCTILTRAACNFYRIYYVPDLLSSYEVSKVTGHSCKYQISVYHTENNTVSSLLVTDSAFTSTGIKITVLGAYDQPQLHMNDFFIQRVGRPSEAYLAAASPRNHPRAGTIGAVQANESFTKSFIFDPDLSKCDFYEDTLRCVTAPDAIRNIRSSQENALPLQRDIHLFHVNDGQLESTLLLSSAVRIQLYFQDFKISVKTTTICPQFGSGDMSITGCYNCPVLARVQFMAHSTCQPGVVTVHFQELNIHTKAITLNTEPTEQIVKFSAEKRCYTEKLCLKSPTLVQCKTLTFCLDEPSVELLQLNTNYTQVTSSYSTSNWWDWVHVPNLTSSYVLLKLIGSSLFIVCLIITTFSTILTCCCRSR